MSYGETSRPGGWAQLDTVRLILAAIVVLAHAYYIFIVPIAWASLLDASRWVSWLAVEGFFVLSGLVIGRTLRLHRDGFLPYMIRRVRRIYPPLIASFVLVVALDWLMRLAGVNNSAIAAAFPMEESFTYDLMRAAKCLLTFGFRGWLSSGSNGALWSLAIEMRCYVVAGLLAYVFIGRNMLIKIASFLALCYVFNLLVHDRRDSLITLSYAAFAIGACLSLVVERIPKFLPTVPLDLSYSLYIFHFPIMLCMFFFFYQPQFPSLGVAFGLAAAAIILAFLLAWISARTIERIRLRLPIWPTVKAAVR